MSPVYQTRRTALHRLDPRLKVAGLLTFSLLLSSASAGALLVMTFFAATISIQSRFNAVTALFSSRLFIILLFLIVISRAVFTPEAPLQKWGPLTFSTPGLIIGVTICWRLLLMVWLSLWLMSVTRSDEINAAIRWFLKPLPIVNANAIGAMLSFLIRFIPIIMTEYRRITQAGRTRLIDANHNPLFRIRYQVIPLMRNLFQTSEDFAQAMISRCYTADRTDPEFAFQKSDYLALLVLLLVCSTLVCAMLIDISFWQSSPWE